MSTSRQFAQAVALAVALVLLGCALYLIEKFVFAAKHRFVENPTEVMVRTFGLAHFLVGWMFLVTSSSVRSGSALLRLAGWSLVGVLLCVGYYEGGAGKSFWTVLGFYGLFLVHEIGDQAQLFLARDDVQDIAERTNLVRLLGLSVTSALVAILIAGRLSNSLLFGDVTLFDQVPAPWIALGLGSLATIAAAAGGRFLQLGRRSTGGVTALYLAFEPLLMVYLTLGAILICGVFLGSGALNLIILIHVTTWMVSVYQRLDPAATWQGLTHWLRRTRTGFLTLHVGLALVILVLLALRVHVWERAGFFNKLLSGSSFPYWSLFHIAVAFARR